MFDTGAQQSMICRGGWKIIRRHDTWIYARGVDLGGPPKAGNRLQVVNARGGVKNCMDGKSYLVIISQAFFNPNLDKPCWRRTILSAMVLRYFHFQGSFVAIS